MALDQIELEFTQDALELIADYAIEHKLGARGLRTICESILRDAMFELPSEGEAQKLVINSNFVNTQLRHSINKKSA